jgi:amino acid transporter
MAEHQEDGQPQTGVAAAPEFRDRDERKLAELGYKQELERAWSGFSNFAISFTIISILAGCFTTYGQAWNNGGPIAISIGWPLICIIVLIVAFCMAERAAPTGGRPGSAARAGPGSPAGSTSSG